MNDLRKAIAYEAMDRMVAENQRLGLYDDGPAVKTYAGGKPNYCTPEETRDNSSWVGLTDEEIYDYADKFLYQHGSNYGIRSFGKAIEAKLKEKNCG